jgi:hypothetical protein
LLSDEVFELLYLFRLEIWIDVHLCDGCRQSFLLEVSSSIRVGVIEPRDKGRGHVQKMLARGA